LRYDPPDSSIFSVCFELAQRVVPRGAQERARPRVGFSIAEILLFSRQDPPILHFSPSFRARAPNPRDRWFHAGPGASSTRGRGFFFNSRKISFFQGYDPPITGGSTRGPEANSTRGWFFFFFFPTLENFVLSGIRPSDSSIVSRLFRARTLDPCDGWFNAVPRGELNSGASSTRGSFIFFELWKFRSFRDTTLRFFNFFPFVSSSHHGPARRVVPRRAPGRARLRGRVSGCWSSPTLKLSCFRDNRHGGVFFFFFF
jgi:hypothetical protein